VGTLNKKDLWALCTNS